MCLSVLRCPKAEESLVMFFTEVQIILYIQRVVLGEGLIMEERLMENSVMM